MKAIGRSLVGRRASSLHDASRVSRITPCITSRTFTKPAFAPKPIIDIKHIRQAPGLYEQNCIDRNYGAHSKNSWRIIELHEQWLALQQSARELRSRNKQLRDQIAKDGAEKQKALGEAKAMKTELSEVEAKETQLQEEIEALAQDLPNLSSTHTPVGTEATLVDYIGEHPDPSNSKPWKSHVDIGQQLGILDFAGASQTSGWGWYFLVGDGAMLEQALVQYALSVARGKRWKVVAPPSLVYSHIASACGFQPRDQNDEQQVYAIEQPEKDKAKPQLALAGTAEIPLAGMKANAVLNEAELPLKTVGVSRCYRAEAGARGADTKGLYRVHEFTKVEMFAWAAPDQTGEDHFAATDASSSETVFEEMLGMQHEILTALGLHCRILEMPTTDLGASAIRKRDIEAFFPSRRSIDDGWGEVTSTSMCTDYQSRRLHTRLRTAHANKLGFPFTLNGTALAVPRVLAAILENHWDEKSATVRIPPVLQPFMGGQTEISKQA
ncbi:seryl-tRNA synthetase [Macroventuria anomochaeta]|uniref:Seryl-tRNA synthetase n=1 Tax=Macroventuria anomochaeta TaxID=301207 RepID=A0ACB6S3F6_9PLEO|nr:seryl-tRNA synthetase [Macroventuria anomochaeta]KAF2628791.1 seryl-tRNA synthetase [Macroventuria anomochaeta]